MRKSILLITLFAVMALVAFLYAFQFSERSNDSNSVNHFAIHHDSPLPPIEASTPARADSNVKFSWKFANPYLLKTGDGNVFLELEIAGKALANARRKPVNLVLVIDRSGSMGSENKLQQVKDAAAAIIDQMNPTDRIAAVIYDDAVETLIPSTLVENKETLKTAINSLTPGGSTNLYGGLEQGFQAARENFRTDSVNRIILLSDGLANAGVTDPAQITSEARNIRENKISVSTMGVGIDYNESLMANVADFSGGNYYYISSSRNMTEVFRKEWNMMEKLVANNAHATFDLANGVDVVDVAGFTWRKEGRRLKIEVPDIYSGETKRILVQLRATTNARSIVDLGTGSFSCTEISGTSTRSFAQVFHPFVKIVEDPALVRRNMDHDVSAKVASVVASQKMEEAYKRFEAGENEPARGLAQKAIDDLKALGYVETNAQVARYQSFAQAAAAPPSAMPEESKKDILKKQKEADRSAQQNSPQ
jgi:Ca-activated chloride channel homolog